MRPRGRSLMAASPLRGKYEAVIDRDSAFERLRTRSEAAAKEAAAAEADAAKAKEDAAEMAREFKAGRRYDGNTKAATTKRTSSRSDSVGTAFAKSFARQLGGKSGQALIRGVLGSLFKSR